MHPGVGLLTKALRLPRGFLCRALTFEELHGAGLPVHADAGRLKRAESDLERFFSIENEIVLDEYLALTGLDRATLLMALCAATVDTTGVPDSDWARLLARCLSGPFLAGADPKVVGAQGLRAPLYPLLNWAKAWVDLWRGRWDHQWEVLANGLMRQLSEQLFTIAYKTFVLEANIAALGRDLGSLGEDTVEIFAGRVTSGSAFLRRLYLRYPALARILATTCCRWRENCEVLLTRFDCDSSAIGAVLFKRPPQRLSEVVVGFSDPHEGGQRVAILKFADGARLVYKPRSIDIDVAYYALLGRLNVAGLEPRLRQLCVVARDGYGWVEYVRPEAMTDQEAIRDFYLRMGAHLSILYLTKATDFHAENVVASGSEPMLVDLETLVHADGAPRAPTTQSLAWRRLHESVFACGLLPGWHDGDPDTPSPEISGIAALDGQTYKDRVDVLHAEGGVVRVVRELISVAPSQNRPLADSGSIDPAAYADEIVEGFERGFRLLAREAAWLEGDSGPLRDLLRAEVRHVALATAAYVALSRRATHPDFLTRATHRELIFAILAIRVRDQPALAPLVKSELAALFGGDVPKFTTRGDTDIVYDENDQALAGYLREPAGDEVTRRLHNLTEARLRDQVHILRLSMATLVTASPRRAPVDARQFDELPATEILREVRGLGEAVLDDATIEPGGIDWIGLSEVDYGRCRVCVLGAEFYEGAAGIGVFLAHAGRRLGEERFLDAAELCGQGALALMERAGAFVGGGFVGRCGAAFGVLQMAAALGRQSWIERTETALLDLATEASKDRIYDIVGGSAGVCGVLLAAHGLTGSPALLRAAVVRAEHLVGSRVDCGQGWGWPSRRSRAPLTGFSHGAAGIGWALLRVGDLAGREDLIEAGRGAFAYERSVYSEDQGGWPDLRDIAKAENGDRYSQAWCHGAPGIGLSRATLPGHLIGASELTEVSRALRSVIAGPLASSDCLCHGELGNLELLQPLPDLGPGEDLGALARRRASAVVWRARQGGWRCGIAPDRPVPGLMTGLSGIGYGLIRIYWPQSTPSLLTLETPRREPPPYFPSAA